MNPINLPVDPIGWVAPIDRNEVPCPNPCAPEETRDHVLMLISRVVGAMRADGVELPPSTAEREGAARAILDILHGMHDRTVIRWADHVMLCNSISHPGEKAS